MSVREEDEFLVLEDLPKCPGCGARISSGSGKCDWCNAFDRKCAEHIAVREEQQYFGGSV